MNNKNVETSVNDNSYQNIRNDFNNNGVDIDLNDTLREQNSFESPTSSKASSSVSPKPPRFIVVDGKARKVKRDTKEHCVFCENNGEPVYVYRDHRTRDEFGRVVCPHLRNYKCPICGSKGDNAHTVKYCPNKPIYTMEDTRTHILRSMEYSTSPPISIPAYHRKLNAPPTNRNNFQNYRF